MLLLVSCAQTAPDSNAVDGAADTIANGPAANDAGTAPGSEAPRSATGAWSENGPIDYRRERAIDLTGDGGSETVIAAARGPAYDSLDISVTIVAPTGDTLWHEAWPSLLYFKYEPLEGKADSTVQRIVTDHVEQLTEAERFTMDGGLPAVLRRGGDPAAIMREAVHYHLAELDWRREAGLSPAVPTPPEAWSAISTESVPGDRVAAVLDDLRGAPSFMYYAGGEATYVIAWSDREAAFVRIFSCC